MVLTHIAVCRSTDDGELVHEVGHGGRNMAEVCGITNANHVSLARSHLYSGARVLWPTGWDAPKRPLPQRLLTLVEIEREARVELVCLLWALAETSADREDAHTDVAQAKHKLLHSFGNGALISEQVWSAAA